MLNPTTTMVVDGLNVTLALLYNVFVFSSIAISIGKVLRRTKPALANLCWYWTKWPALTYLITDPFFAILLEEKLHWWRAAFDVFGVWVWWRNKDMGDDNDNKKLKKKIKEKVIQVSGKLVVVPQPA